MEFTMKKGISEPTLEDSIALSSQAHFGQKDKVGEPYILHPARVMLSLDSTKDRIVGIMHDVLEDTEITPLCLLEFGYPQEIIDDIVGISKYKNENWDQYILRVAKRPRSTRVKIADLKDNSSPVRMYKLPPETRIRLRKKYKSALIFLENTADKEGY